ncbi:hypothetical protein ABPG74_004366 [Tetrahymena malaccensis]
MSFPKSFGFQEDLKNFTLCITQKSNNSVGFVNSALQIQPNIKTFGDNILNISFSHQYGEITSFTLQYQKKNPSAELEVKTINDFTSISSSVVYQQEVKNINSTQIYINSLNYYSVNHYFNINKEKDSFSINFSIESPSQKTTYSYTFYFGLFNALPLKQQQQQMEVTVKHEQEDENLKRLSQSPINHHNLHSNDEALSTKSHSPIQEEILYGHYNIPQQVNLTTTTTTTTQLRTIQDQMKIEDNFETTFARQRKGSKVSSSSNFNNNSEESQSTEFQNSKKSKFDKKNVVKNFVKAFDAFFLDPHNDQQILSISQIQSRDQLKKYRSNYEKLEKSMKYNNKMIIAIIYSEFKDIFQHFLQTEADKWIQNSSVFDKEAHRAILKDYIRAAENPRDIPKIVNLRIRNREANCKLSL